MSAFEGGENTISHRPAALDFIYVRNVVLRQQMLEDNL
jgi:hypothetical protein